MNNRALRQREQEQAEQLQMAFFEFLAERAFRMPTRYRWQLQEGFVVKASVLEPDPERPGNRTPGRLKGTRILRATVVDDTGVRRG